MIDSHEQRKASWGKGLKRRGAIIPMAEIEKEHT